MKKVLLVLLLGAAGLCCADVRKLDPEKADRWSFLGYPVTEIYQCDTKEEVEQLPLIKDRRLSIYSYTINVYRGEPQEEETWTVFYFLKDSEGNATGAVIIHVQMDGKTSVYLITALDTEEQE